MKSTLHFSGTVTSGTFTLDADIAVEPHEVVAVIGPNGAGKSTLLRAIAGLTPLASGSVRIALRVVDDGTSVFVPPAQRSVGVVFQDYRLFPHLTVLDNVAFAQRSAGARRSESQRLATQWCQRFGLGGLTHVRPPQLSGGQAQRVALARALAGNPSALLLDEPLAALDAGTRIDVRSELRQHVRGLTIPTLLVTHDPLDALMVADRIVVLESGRITQQGLTHDVARHPITEYVARLLGLNLLRGVAQGERVVLDDGGTLYSTGTTDAETVFVALRPDSISLHAQQPHVSARNVWQGTVASLEPVGDRVRLTVEGPPVVSVDITAGAVADLALNPGTLVWLSAKATELSVYPDRTSSAG